MGSAQADSLYDIKASYHTLGCKLNFAETSTIGKILKAHGVRESRKGETPNICIVNTCSVTEMADKKSRSLIRKLHRQYPEATIVVTGCYAQLKPEEVKALEGVDMVLGANDKLKIGDYVGNWLSTKKWGAGTSTIVTEMKEMEEFVPSCARGDRTRYFLKVQDGCDYYCTYCTIPYARGRSRSPKIEDLLQQARQVAEEGGKEIVLTGVNIGDFGKRSDETFFDLIKRLDGIEGIERLRISSIEPNLLTEEIIDWIATESRAFMPHFHIPLQSGSDEVLRKMNRRYDTALFRSRIEHIREAIPEAFIGVDVIAGARGETEEEWEKAYGFIKSMDVSRLHVFPYSERPGTAALMLGGEVDKGERNRRAAKLVKLSDEKITGFMESCLGQTRPVLWEHLIEGTGLMTGLTDNYLRVTAKSDEKLLNRITSVRLDAIDPDREETIRAV